MLNRSKHPNKFKPHKAITALNQQHHYIALHGNKSRSVCGGSAGRHSAEVRKRKQTDASVVCLHAAIHLDHSLRSVDAQKYTCTFALLAPNDLDLEEIADVSDRTL